MLPLSTSIMEITRAGRDRAACSRDIDVHVGQRIRFVRLRLELTQEELAEACGYPVAAVRAWEQGRSLDAEALAAVVSALAVRVSFLFSGFG
jgi:transcriptional regulator with XRE-family HTH domain